MHIVTSNYSQTYGHTWSSDTGGGLQRGGGGRRWKRRRAGCKSPGSSVKATCELSNDARRQIERGRGRERGIEGNKTNMTFGI